MAPDAVQSHILCKRYGLMQTMRYPMTTKTPVSYCIMHEFRKQGQISIIGGLPVCSMLCKFSHYLWAALLKMKKHCKKAMAFLQAKLPPFPSANPVKAMSMAEENADVGPWPGNGSVLGSWSWAWARVEPKCFTPEDLKLDYTDDGIVDADWAERTGDREGDDGGEAPMSDWLEWGSYKEEDLSIVPRHTAPQTTSLHRESGSEPCPLTSEVWEQREGIESGSEPCLLTSEVWEQREGIDSDWSDWSEDEEDSEGSAESSELWESFLHCSDPYNPLSFSSVIETGAKSAGRPENCPTGAPENPDRLTRVCLEDDDERNQPTTHRGMKRVRFADVVTVHPLEAFTSESRAARDGSCWLELARDRERFKRRVLEASDIISPCLLSQHRGHVWERLQRNTHS